MAIPSQGAFCDFERVLLKSYFQRFFGSKMVTSPCAPGASVPRPSRFTIRAGFAESSPTSRAERHLALVVKRRASHAEGDLQSGDAEGGAVKLHILFKAGVRRMVGGDGSRLFRPAIRRSSACRSASLAQRRIHLVVRVVAEQFLVGEA